MKVQSIELLSLKSYEHITIEFSSGINLLLGANNSGKSSIIKSLLNLQYKAFDEKDIRVGHQSCRIITRVTDVNEKDNSRFYDRNNHKEYEVAPNFEIYWTFNGQSEEYLYVNSSHNIQRRDPDDWVNVTDKEGQKVSLKTFPRFPDSENANNFIYPFLTKRKTEFYDGSISREQSFRVDQGLRNLAAKIQKIGNASHPRNSEFTSLCQEILGFSIGVIPIGESHLGQEPGIYVSHTSTIPLRGMGDGVVNIVGFIVTLLTEDGKLYLVEEVENDIHPLALKKLLTLIKRKSINNQFIISTHSHIVLKHLGIIPDAKIFYIDWSLEGSVPTSSVNQIENRPETRIEALEKLGYDFQDFELYEAYLFLEESSAERVIKDFLIPNFVPGLYNRLKTIAAKGVDDVKPRVIDFHRLFVFIHTSPIYNGKAWVILDGDKAGIDCIAELKSTFEEWPESHFTNFSKNNFEEYFPDKFASAVDSLSKLRGPEKQAAKKKLILEVMEWALKHREEAISAFRSSAKEVIVFLESIEKSLKS